MPSLMQWRGRKLAFVTACFVFCLGWMVAFAAQNITSVLISECLLGFGSNCIFTISWLSISEMTSPEHRETFMLHYMLCQLITMSLNGLLTQYLHWKTIALVMMVPTLFSVMIGLAWPESPYWLAYKGKISRCEKSFKWLRGSGPEANKELNDLIKKQRETSVVYSDNNITLNKFWSSITDKAFYVPAIHMFFLDCLPFWSGLPVILIYSIDVINKTTENETAKFFSALILNAIAFCGMAGNIILIKYFKKKTIVLNSACGMIVFLVGASIVSFLQSVGTLSKDSVLCLLFLVAYTLSASLGVMGTPYAISSSLMPVKYRGMGGTLLFINGCLLHASVLKVAPYLILYINLWGTFLVYTLNAAVCSLVILKYIPDTDSRTLNEIENYYVYGVFDKSYGVSLKDCEYVST